jgi:HEAT repeat protein
MGGAESLNEFRRRYQAIYEEAPLQAVRLFLYYLSIRGVDPLAETMATWATSGTLHISVLLDTDVLDQESITPAVGYHAIPFLPELDPQFMYKFATTVAALQDAVAILRALRLVPAMSDYSILIPWLRTLSASKLGHTDRRVRSRAAKLLCQARPSDGQIKRSMESRDERVRASAIEALWNPRMTRKDQEVRTILQNAVSDPNHRVVANALVGLYLMGDTEALQKMIELCDSKNHLFRAAMAWAMGIVEDLRAAPALQRLALEPSFIVRQRALNSLMALSAGTTNQVDNEAAAVETKKQVMPAGSAT